MSPRDKTNNWLAIRVELVSGRGDAYDPPPGRDFFVSPRDTFADLAEAINTAFARWDISHLHEFRLADGRRIGLPEDSEADVEPEHLVTVASTAAENPRFTYVFDFGDDWTHECTVIDDTVDPEDTFGYGPRETPVAILGWGTIPDQYGRDRPDPD